jgi:hypothetical protein
MPRCGAQCSDRTSANAAATGLQSYDEAAWRVQPAPGADEVLWGALGLRLGQRLWRRIGMWTLFVAILALYLPVTAAIQV